MMQLVTYESIKAKKIKNNFTDSTINKELVRTSM